MQLPVTLHLKQMTVVTNLQNQSKNSCKNESPISNGFHAVVLVSLENTTNHFGAIKFYGSYVIERRNRGVK